MITIDHVTDLDAFRGIKFDSRSRMHVSTKVVVQEIPSRLYLSEDDFLTLDIENARKFDSYSAALEETSQLKLQDVQLVMNRERKEWEILPIGTPIIV